jgi:hypothetical protein
MRQQFMFYIPASLVYGPEGGGPMNARWLEVELLGEGQ